MASNIFGALAQAIPGIQGQALQGANEGGQVAWERARSTRKLDLEEQARKDALQQSMAEFNSRMEETKAQHAMLQGQFQQGLSARASEAAADRTLREKLSADTNARIAELAGQNDETKRFLASSLAANRTPPAPIVKTDEQGNQRFFDHTGREIQLTDPTGKPIGLGSVSKAGDPNGRYEAALRNNSNVALSAIQTLDADRARGYRPGDVAQFANSAKGHILGFDVGAALKSKMPEEAKAHISALRTVARLKAMSNLGRGATQGMINDETESILRSGSLSDADVEDVKSGLRRIGAYGPSASAAPGDNGPTPPAMPRRGAVLQDLNALRGSGFGNP